MSITKITPMTTEILSLPIKTNATASSKADHGELPDSKIIPQYDSFEQKAQQGGVSNEDLGTYTREFRRTQSDQISALLDDPLDDPPAIVIAPSPEELERRRLSKEYWAAADSWNAKVDELKAMVKARNYGYNETIKLFKEGYADWKADLKKTNPEVYLLWIERAGESS